MRWRSWATPWTGTCASSRAASGAGRARRSLVAVASAGYSGTPLARKLGIAPHARVVVRHGPANYAALLAPVPAGIVFEERITDATDITDAALRTLPLGFVDVKVCAVDEVWSGLKFVVRKALR